MPKMVHFGEFLKNWSLRSNSVTRQVNFNGTKIGGKYQNSKIQMQHFGWFLNIVTFWKSIQVKWIFMFDVSDLKNGQVLDTLNLHMFLPWKWWMNFIIDNALMPKNLVFLTLWKYKRFYSLEFSLCMKSLCF